MHCRCAGELEAVCGTAGIVFDFCSVYDADRRAGGSGKG